ncbi:MAG: ABC transporter substrate-binding protein [Ilumatobacteraceae bacterium]
MRLRAALLVALVVAGATACGGGDDDSAAPATDSVATSVAAAPSTAPSPPPSTDGPRVERIIPVNGDLAEVVYALGLGDEVVATDISATYPAAAQATPKIGYQRALVAETILSFEPTVVLADDNAGPPEVLDQVQSAGVRVVDLPHQSTLESVSEKIRAVADALAVPARGEELVATFEDELDEATTRADAAVATSGRPKVLALYLRGTNVQLVFGEGSGIDAVIAAAGGTDLGTEMGVVDNAELSTEAIVAAAPDILLVTTTGLGSVGGVDGLLAIPGIDQTPAAANRQVVAFEDQYLYGLGPRTGQLVGELVDAFHPAT